MTNVLRYLITAVLTFGLISWYLKPKETVKPIDDSKEPQIEMYALTQFFQIQTLSFIDSPAFVKEQKQNFAFLAQLKDKQSALFKDFASGLPCKGLSNASNCVLTMFVPSSNIADGCLPCSGCCPVHDQYRLAAYDIMDSRFYYEGKEVKLFSTLTNGIRIFDLSKKTVIDRVTIDIAGLHELSMKK
jgi:hypothetical protein